VVFPPKTRERGMRSGVPKAHDGISTRRPPGDNMPIVRIDLIEGKTEEYRTRVGEIVYQTLVDVLDAPEGDRFQVITEHRKNALSFDREYLNVHRTDDCVFFQIALNVGRSVELKRIFYKELTDRLYRVLALRKEDVFINLLEVTRENWSYGNGLAQYSSR
jgi:phenylpyruvate tautomerase PptA (4-oxalocrotonate tautomerase family)